MTLADAIHKELEEHGRVSYPRRQELAEQYKVKPSIVRDEVHGAMRERMDEMPGSAGSKEWHRMRIMAELDAAKKLARERKGHAATKEEVVEYADPDIPSLVRAIIADAQVNGLMAKSGGAPKKDDDKPADGRSDEEIWLNALKDCPREVLMKHLQSMKGMH